MKEKRTPFPFFKYGFLAFFIAFLIVVLFKITETTMHQSIDIVQLPGSDQPLHLYSNQADDDLLHLYTSAIDSAKKTLSLAIFKLTNRQIIHALKKKSAEGVAITIVINAQGGLSRLTMDFAGLPVRIVRRTGDGLMHQKILVIDNERVLLGSANLTTASLKSNGNLVIGFENHALASMLANKINSMDDSHGSISFPPQETMIGGQKVELWLLPENAEAMARVKSLLFSAKKGIRVAMYTFTRRDIANELINAYKRGINIKVIVDYTVKLDSKDRDKIIRKLCDANLPVNLNMGPSILHYKLAMIDDDILISGSMNWTTRGFNTNDDCFMVVHSLTKEQQDKLNSIWSVIQRKSEPACTHASFLEFDKRE